MTTPQAPSTPDRTWGATPAPAPKQAWSPGKKIAAGAVAAVLVAGGGAAVWAASSSSAATETRTGPGGMAGGPGGRPGGGLAGALHGEYVASDGNGGYVTKIVQTGEITELSATSLTAESDDGFSKTYTITSAQATGLATGDAVTVTATESGSTATATSVTDGESGGPGTPPSGAPTG